MTPTSSSAQLVNQVKSRLHLASLGSQAYRFFKYATAIYALYFVAIKLLGLLPDHWASIYSVAAVPLAAALLAVIFHPRPTPADAAHRIDQRMLTKDLFLTQLSVGPTEFAPLVSREADRQAPGIRPQTVAPFDYGAKTLNSIGLAALLALAVWLSPQFDPFGFADAKLKQEQKQTQLDELAKKAETKKVEIKKAAARADLERKEQQAKLAMLRETFRTMDRNNQQGNQNKLQQQHKQMGQFAKQKKSQHGDAVKQNNRQSLQKFGAVVDPKVRQWADQMRQGDVKPIKEHVGEIKALAQKLANAENDAEKQKLMQQMQQKMNQLQQAMQDGSSTQELNDTVQQAIDQMQAGQQSMSQQQMQQAMQQMQQSLDMSQMQMDQMAQSIQDMQELDQAMEAIESAMQANGQQSLDGSDCESCQGGMAQYAQLYNELQQQGQGGGGGQGGGQGAELLTRQGSPGGSGSGSGSGGGMGGPGQGRGGVAGYDDSINTQFKDERAKSKYQAGKILMSIKTRELSHKGEAQKEYEQAVATARQLADAAVQSDEIEPGYHEAIQGYYGQGFEKAIDSGGADDGP